MTSRYLFLCPDAQNASGGIAVIYDAVAVLNNAGFDAVVLHNSPTAGYRDHPKQVPCYYTSNYIAALGNFVSKRSHFSNSLTLLKHRLRSGPLEILQSREGDIVVVPEFMMAAAMLAFPNTPLGVFVQNPFAFQETHAEGLKRGLDIRDRAQWFLGVSQLCMDQLELLDIKTGHYLPVSMKPEDFPFSEDKEALITYMPRKRPTEAQQIVDMLSRRGKLDGYRLQALDKMNRSEISEQLQRSRFFISLQQRESIGFPAAEAMAAGCIVVGYTGLGGREYFTSDTGGPVVEDDTVALINALEETVAEYSADPVRLDRVRRHASDLINQRYSWHRFEKSLIETWRELESA